MLLARFWKNAHGGVAPMLALAIIPLLTAVGSAIDYGRASSARTSFQTALDSTALMMSKVAATSTGQQLTADATDTLNALFSRPDVSGVTVTASYVKSGGSKVILTANAAIATEFLTFLGYSTIPISASATASWGNTRLRVSLVLDNTGSMSQDNKMTALQTASHNLLTQLQSAASTSDDVYVSIIPFNKDVNIGSSNYTQPWLRWDLWDAANGTCTGAWGSSQTKCQNNGGTWAPAAHSTWNGCLTDRDQNYDTTNDAPVAGSTLYPTEQYSSCPTQLIGLSNDWTALSNKIDAMAPKGNTNQAVGLQVGWQSLTASPFTVPPFDSNYSYKQVIILLTDGLNTQDRWYTNQSQIDARQEKTCDNIKAAGITLYTVQVDTSGDPTSTLLQYCASDSNKFYLLTSADGIVTTFNQIGTALTNLRLTN